MARAAVGGDVAALGLFLGLLAHRLRPLRGAALRRRPPPPRGLPEPPFPLPFPCRLALAAFDRPQVDPAARRLDAVDADPDRVAHADRRPLAGADQHRLGRVELVALAAADQPRRQEPLVDVGHRPAEADEGAAADHSRNLAVEAASRGRASNSSRRSRKAAQTSSPVRSALAESRSRSEQCTAASAMQLGAGRVLLGADQRQQRPVGDQVGVAADRRGEVGVGGAAEAGVAEVRLAVVGLLHGSEHERCIRLAAVAAPLRLARRRGGWPRPRSRRPGWARCAWAAAASGSPARRAAPAAARSARGRAARAPGRASATRLRSVSSATCSLVSTISCSIRRWDSVCSTASAPTTSPSSKRNSGSALETSSALPARRSASAAAALRASAIGSATSPGARLRPAKISSIWS